MRTPYPTDLTDAQWELVAPHIPAARGRRRVDIRQVVDAILYLTRAGCQWRMLPHDFPPWKTVSYDFYPWRDAGVWDRLHDVLRRDTRRLLDREDTPCAGVIDSQSVKTTESGGPKGYDGGGNRRPEAALAG